VSRAAFDLRSRRRWLVLAVGVLGAELAWLGLLYPLVPITVAAWGITLIFPVALGIYVWGVVALLGSPWPIRHVLLQRALAFLLAVSPGVVLLVGLYAVQALMPSQFRYGF
jgi:hypothetical protein